MADQKTDDDKLRGTEVKAAPPKETAKKTRGASEQKSCQNKSDSLRIGVFIAATVNRVARMGCTHDSAQGHCQHTSRLQRRHDHGEVQSSRFRAARRHCIAEYDPKIVHWCPQRRRSPAKYDRLKTKADESGRETPPSLGEPEANRGSRPARPKRKRDGMNRPFSGESLAACRRVGRRNRHHRL